MRGDRHIQSRGEVRLDRVQVIWLTLGALVAMGALFAFGVVVGRRQARFDTARAQDSITKVDADSERHERLTFYDDLTAKRPERPPPAGTEQPAAARNEVPTEPAAAPTESPTAQDAPDEEIRAAMASRPSKSGDYTVQVSAFQSKAEARAAAAQLERKGFTPFVVRSEIAGKGTWFRVRLGRFASEAEASRAKMILAAADIPAWVLRTE